MRKSFLEYCFAMVRELEASAEIEVKPFTATLTICGSR